LFLWVWTVFVVVFFSLSDSKLMPYVLPALPALALLIATADRESFLRDFRKSVAFCFLLSAVLGVGAYELPQILATSDRQEFFLPLRGPLVTIAILLAACGALLVVQRSFGLARSTAIFAASWCLAWLILIRGASSVAPIYSGERLAQAIPAGDQAPVYCVATYDQTLPFYLGRTITLVHFRGELDYGLKLKPDAMIADLGEFIERWNGAEQSYALMEKSMFEELRGRGAMMRILKTSAERLVVARR
jgi:4-amino-4-deoxy-L-arabinose transferase-like glycosyltransferase